MTLLYPGVLGQRRARSSELFFGWRAADGVLASYTGQTGTFTHGVNTGPVVGLSGGPSITAGKSQPRFTAAFDATPRLRVQGDTPGAYDEKLSYTVGMFIQPITLYVKARSMYTLGAGGDTTPGNHLVMLGNTSANGGLMSISRIQNGVWHARRLKAGGSGGSVSISATAETGAWSPIMEFALALNANGSITFTLRDGNGATQHMSTSSADADLCTLTDTWDGNALVLGLNGAELGGDFDYEALKLARGVKTLDQIVALF